MTPRKAQPMRHWSHPSALWSDKELSGAEYTKAIRAQDEAFVRSLALAYRRGEFPPECYPREAA